MVTSRRQFFKKILTFGAHGAAIATGFIFSSVTKAQWIHDKFNLGDYHQTMFHLFDGAEFTNSKQITISKLPRVAENGANVPITIDSSLNNITRIFLLVENNPHPLIAEFVLSPAVVAHVSARIKMAKDSDVIVIIESEGKLFRKTQKVKVTVGGCG